MPQNTLFHTAYHLTKNKNKDALTSMVEEGFCINTPQNGYSLVELLARQGDVESVEFLMAEFRANQDDAAKGYAQGGHVDQVNMLVTKGADRKLAALGYKMYMGDHPHEISLLRLMSLTDDNEMRILLAEKMKEQMISLNLDPKLLLKKADEIHVVMKVDSLTFFQAQQYLAIPASGFFSFFKSEETLRANDSKYLNVSRP
ncbi:MAG: hypothetical protein ACYC0J_09030, partial [Gammaproteobacteria bacterium]